MVKTNTFNGVPIPTIALWNSKTDELKMIRQFNYEEFVNRLSWNDEDAIFRSELNEGETRKNIPGFMLFPAPWKNCFLWCWHLAVPKRFWSEPELKDPLFVSREFLRSRKLIAQLIINLSFRIAKPSWQSDWVKKNPHYLRGRTFTELGGSQCSFWKNWKKIGIIQIDAHADLRYECNHTPMPVWWTYC